MVYKIFDSCRFWLWLSLQMVAMTLLLMPCCEANSYANLHRGFYINLQAGYSQTNYTNQLLPKKFQAQKIEQSGLAPRLNLGYDIVRYFGIELSMIYFKKPIFDGIPGTRQVNMIIKNNVVSLLTKISLPIGRWSIYANSGIGYVVRNGIKSGNRVILKENEFVRPVYGIGINFALNHRWGLNANWIQALRNRNDQLPNSNFYGLGAYYKFF